MFVQMPNLRTKWAGGRAGAAGKWGRPVFACSCDRRSLAQFELLTSGGTAEDLEELHNGCDWKTNIGGFLTFGKWRKWCADNQGITDFGHSMGRVSNYLLQIGLHSDLQGH